MPTFTIEGWGVTVGFLLMGVAISVSMFTIADTNSKITRILEHLNLEDNKK